MNNVISDKTENQSGSVQSLTSAGKKVKKPLPANVVPLKTAKREWEVVSADLPKLRNIVERLSGMGYACFPAKDSSPMAPFKDKPGYTSDRGEWSGANMIAVRLDGALLLDIDGNKGQVTKSLLGEIHASHMAAKVQHRLARPDLDEPGDSEHFLFRADGWSAETHRMCASGELEEFVDLKTGNQLLYIKPGKTIFWHNFKPVNQLMSAPAFVLDVLRKGGNKATRTTGGACLKGFTPSRWPELEAAINFLREKGTYAGGGELERTEWLKILSALKNFEGSAFEAKARQLWEDVSIDADEAANKWESETQIMSQWNAPIFMARDIAPDAFPVAAEAVTDEDLADEVTAQLSTCLGGELERLLHPEEAFRLSELNKKYTLTVHKGGRPAIAYTAKSDFYADEWKFITKESFLDDHAPAAPVHGYIKLDAEEGGNKEGRPINIAKAWLHWPDRNAKMNGMGLYPPPLTAPENVLNLWQGYTVQPAEGDTAPFLHLVQTVLCSDDSSVSSYWLQWMAHLFQKPAEKPSVAVALVGDYGSGKGTIGKVLSDLLGGMATQQTGLNAATGKFNSILAEKILLVADEVKTRSGEQADALKNIISEAKAYFEGKGVDGRDGRSFLRVQINSNHEDAIKLTKGDRRFLVPRIDNSYAGNRANPEHLTKSKPYWDRFNAWWKIAENKAAVLHYLLTMDLSAFDPYNAPHSERAADIIAASMDRLDEWLLSQLAPGHMLDGTEVNAASLLAAYHSSLERRRLKDERAEKPLEYLIGKHLVSMGAGSPVGRASARRRKM
ncbi:MAG: DUF5906 domain-containing protein, partial [Pantoea sp.]|nr:DUF5906 domain-containing protein [Pantoea sp.]